LEQEPLALQILHYYQSHLQLVPGSQSHLTVLRILLKVSQMLKPRLVMS
jgi:hypothetical protein